MVKKANERKRIGLLINNDDLGVIYYLNNIVKSLNYLEDEKKPQIILLFDNNNKKYLEIFSHYQYLESYFIAFPNMVTVYFKSLIKRENFLLNKLLKEFNLSGILPANDILYRYDEKNGKVVAWITDFQHKFYPQYFSKPNIIFREFRFKKAFKNAADVILSSEDAKVHLLSFYDSISANLHVLNFVSHTKDISTAEFKDVEEKYAIKRPFFLVSNQFYRHKNHIVVFEAIKILLDSGNSNFDVIFTGKKEDYRDKNFFPEVEKYITENNLLTNAKVLGVIPREEQLTLLKYAEAIIQPSFFEGWNTTIEDAKTLQQQVICSDINVHKEQMGNKAFYFSPKDSNRLSDIMLKFIKKEIQPLPVFNNFEERVEKFAKRFIKIFDEN